MIWLILWLLTALTGTAEDVPVPTFGEVVTEPCSPDDGFDDDCNLIDPPGSTPPPSELPGPRR